MTSSPALPPERWRPSDDDRRVVFTRLEEAVNEGRLGLTEYDSRLRAAEQAPTMAALQQVVADLPAPPEPVLVRIGELAVTASYVYTPAGPIPLRGAQWQVQDHWVTHERMATWGIVLAILLFCIVGPFSLLFLLAKTSWVTGTVDVTVTNGPRQYTARIPAWGQHGVHYVYHQVNYARSLGAR